jgi:hypothetical protein
MALCPVCGNPGFLGVADNPQTSWCADHYPEPLPQAERARLRSHSSDTNHSPPPPLKPRRTHPEDHGCAHPGCAEWGSYGYAPPGLAGLEMSTVWYCAEHRPEPRGANKNTE